MYITDIDKLKETLTKKGVTMDDLADYIGVDRSTIFRRIKANKLHISDMQKAAEMLELSAEQAISIFLSVKSH